MSALKLHEYSYVYAIQTSATQLAEQDTDSKVPSAKHLHFDVPPSSTCLANHAQAGQTLGLKQSFQPSRMRCNAACCSSSGSLKSQTA